MVSSGVFILSLTAQHGQVSFILNLLAGVGRNQKLNAFIYRIPIWMALKTMNYNNFPVELELRFLFGSIFLEPN